MGDTEQVSEGTIWQGAWAFLCVQRSRALILEGTGVSGSRQERPRSSHFPGVRGR